MGDKIFKFIVYKFPALLYIAAIFILSSMSHPPVPPMMNDKVLHGIEFLILVLLIYRAFNNGLLKKMAMGAVGGAVIFSFVYGALDELHQMFVENRVSSFNDYIADCAGIIVGIGAILLVNYFLKGRSFEFV
jgi:VanZ family protein